MLYHRMRNSFLKLTFIFISLLGLKPANSETIKIELNSGALRLRQTPNAEANSCGNVPNGSNLTVISSSNGWYQVRTNSAECPVAWIHSYFTSEYYDGPQSREFLNQWNPTTTRIEVGEGQLRLRNHPRSNSSTCGTIDDGTQVERLAEDDGWFLIRTNNRNCPTAWVHGYYTEGQYQGPQTDTFLRSWRPSTAAVDVARDSATDLSTPRYDITISTKNNDGGTPDIRDEDETAAEATTEVGDTNAEDITDEVSSSAIPRTVPDLTSDLSALSDSERRFYGLPSAREFKLDPSQRTEAGFCVDCLNREDIVPEDFPVLAEGLSGVTQPIGWDVTAADRRLGGRCISDKEELEARPRPTFPELNPQKISAIESELFNQYNVNPTVFRRTLAYYQENASTIRNARYVTIVDMSQPAQNHRKFLIDLQTGEVEPYYTSHGRGSDPSQSGMVGNFGNGNGSNRTPSGFHLTGQIYNGKYGASLPLHGQEDGVNDESCRRAIVIHQAKGYGGIAASDASEGNRWRSNGCFAMNRNETQEYIERTENGSVYYVYDGN